MRHKPLLYRGFSVRQLFALVGVVLVVASGFVSFASKPQIAAAAPATINFQARLENSSGSIAADGDYNVEFKIYNTQSTGGTSQGVCTGACQWVETRTSTDKVHVVNGYLTANLGSVTAFSGTMPWDTDLWITMNIGGTGSPSWDGEMSPRLKLTAVPYAFQAAQASKLQVTSGGNTATLQFASVGQATTITLPDPGGAGTATVCYQGSASCGFVTGAATNFIQNGTSVQTNANFNIRSVATGSVGGVIQGANGQTADLLQLQSWNGTTNTNVFAVSAAGVVTLAGGQTLDVTTATAATANGIALAPGVSSAASGTGAGLTLRGGEVNGTTSVTGGQVTIQGGNATGASGTRNGGAVTIDGGTGATANGTVNIGTANAPTINIGSVGSTAKATAIHIGDTTTTTAGAIQSITIGSNSNLAHTTVIQGGSGNTAGSEAIRLVPQTAGGIAIGSTTGTGTITLGQANASNTINVGSADFTTASTQTINIANGLQTTAASTLNVNILSNTGNGTAGNAILRLGNNDRVQQIDIGNVTSDGNRTLNMFTGNTGAGITDTINLGTGNAQGTKAVHIADGTPTGSGVNQVTIGSITALANTTTIQGGNGSGAVSIQAATSGTISVGTTNANTVNVGSTNASTTTTINGGGGVNIGTGGVANTVQVGNTSGAVSQTINIGTNATASSTNNVTIGAASTSSSSVTINAGAGAGNLITLQGNNSTGGVKVKSATNSTAAFLIQDSGTNNYLTVDTSGAAISVGYASSTTTLNGTVKVATIGSATVNSQLLCRDSSTNALTACNATVSGTAFVQGGNAFGATAVLGTTDTNNLQFETNSVIRATFDQSNGLYLGNGITAAAPSNFTVAGTGSSTVGTAGAALTVQGGAGATTSTGSAGGNLVMQAGTAGGTGNNAGGNLLLQGGARTGTGTAGAVIAKSQTDSTSAFQVQNAAGSTTVFTVDTSNSRVGINTSGAPASTLEINGTLRVSGSATETFTTPAGIPVTTKINIPIFDPGDNNQILSLGLPTTTVNGTSRVISIFDGRTGAHQPSLAVFSPNESSIIGFNWNGSNTGALVMTSDVSTSADSKGVTVRSGAGSGGGNTGALILQSGNLTGGTGTATGGVTLQSGDGGGTNSSSGNVVIDSGAKSGTGTNGSITIGGTNAPALNLGRSGGTTTLNGVTKVTTLGAVSANATAVCRDTSTFQLISCDTNTSARPFIQGGNSFGAAAVLGTNDTNNLQFETNNVTRATFDQSNGLYLGLGITAASPTAFTVAGTGSATAGTAGGALSIQGGAGATTTTGSAGGALNLTGGAAGGSGNNNGGAIAIQGGTATGSGTVGNVSIQASGGNLGVGTATPTRTLDVAVNNSAVNALPVLIEQAGAGDSGIEYKTSSKNFYTGIDNTDGMFKISSNTAANGTSNMGNTNQEAGTDSNSGKTSAMQATATATGAVSSISVYITSLDSTPANRMIQVGIYANQTTGCNAALNPCPGALLGSSAAQTAVVGWNTISVSGANVTNGSTYWIALSENGSNVYADNGGGAVMAYTGTSNYPIANPFVKATASVDRASFYATISVTGSADNFASNALFRMSDSGAVIFQNSINSTAGFQIQRSDNTNLLNIDTTNAKINLGVTGATALAGQVSIGTSTGATQIVNIGSDNSNSAANGTSILIQGGNQASAVAIQSLASGTISIGTAAAGNVTVGNAGGVVTLQGTVKVSTLGAVSANATAVCRDTSTSQLISCDTNTSARPFIQGGNTFGATATLGTNDGNSLSFETNNVVRVTLDTSNNLYLGLGVTAAAPTAFTIQTTGSSAATVAGAALTVKGGTGNTTGAGGAVTVQGGQGGATGQGGNLTLQGGTAGGGNTNGGNVNVTGGTGAGSGVTGLVVINTPTFQTASLQTCATSCTVTQANVDGNGAVIITASAASLNVTMNDPTITTAGRIVYVTAALGSNDFTLIVNGGGTGNQIAMRANTTATMIWNGSDWTAAGASSSTTLQAAYDNTLTSAGGAELVVANTANANGLTIRDSSSNPVNGTLLEVQSATAANLFSVNSNVTDYANDPGAETAGGTTSTFPASTWSAVGSASVSRYTTAGTLIATGIASVQTTTTNVTNDGVKNQLSTSLTANNHYNVSFTTRLTPGQTFTSMQVLYSPDGTLTSPVTCITGQSVATSVWTKVNCTITAPASGITSSNAIIIRQTVAGIRTFYIDNLSVTIAADFNLATDGGVDDSGNFATNWTTAGLGTVAVTRNTTDGNDASDSAQVAVTAGAANAGARNKLAINPLAGANGTLYRMSAYVKLNSGAAFTDFKIRYSRDGGTNFVDCVDYNTQTVVTTGWTQITCYVTTDSTAPTNPYVYFVETASGVRNFSVDTFSITLAQTTTPNVQIGGGLNGGPTTLFTVDRGASAPIAANNDAFLGSMYYDTTLGKLQCYESDGWGACGSSPDNIVTISPEYTNAVLHGTGIGTMTSDMCSDQLNINDGSSSQPTICGSNETFNFYRWTSPQASAQTYSIYVTYQLPTTFKTFQSGTTSIMGRTDSTNATVQYTVYRNSATGLSQCGSTVAVSTGISSSWTTGTASGAADPSTCGFAGGNSIVFKIDVIANSNANAYVSNLGFTFTNQ